VLNDDHQARELFVLSWPPHRRPWRRAHVTIRGATTIGADEPALVREATVDLLNTLMARM
jgi:hypothetical protein